MHGWPYSSRNVDSVGANDEYDLVAGRWAARHPRTAVAIDGGACHHLFRAFDSVGAPLDDGRCGVG